MKRPNHIYLIIRETIVRPGRRKDNEIVRRIPTEVVNWEGENPVIRRLDGNWEEYQGDWEAVEVVTPAPAPAPAAKPKTD